MVLEFVQVGALVLHVHLALALHVAIIGIDKM